MIIQNESRLAKIDSWVHKLLLRGIKQKQKTKINQQIIIKITKNLKKQKIKGMRNITPTIDHYSRNGQMGETDP